MKKRILLTSFDTWLDEQQSNSSDDLLLELLKLDSLPYDLKFLRLLPVDIELASTLVMAKIEEYQPDYIVSGLTQLAQRAGRAVRDTATIKIKPST